MRQNLLFKLQDVHKVYAGERIRELLIPGYPKTDWTPMDQGFEQDVDFSNVHGLKVLGAFFSMRTRLRLS